MKKLFVSVPMRGRTEEEIKATIAKMKKIAEAFEGEELELIDSYIPGIPDGVKNTPVWCLSRYLQMLSEADVFIGMSDAWHWNGCFIESEVATRYDIKNYAVHSGDIMSDYWDKYNKDSFNPTTDAF